MRYPHIKDEGADQLVLDYLRRVGDVAHRTLRSDERLDFLSRLRTRIEEHRVEAGAAGREQVGEIIARFGDPARLVERERRRLEEQREDAVTEAAIARVASDEPEPDSEGSTQPIPIVEDSETSGLADSLADTDPETLARDDGQPGAPPHQPGAAAPEPGDAPRESGAAPSGAAPPAAPEPSGRGALESVNLRALVGTHRWETAGVILLSLGGLVFPFPYVLVVWVLAAGCVAVSRGWPARDKLIGLAAPAGAVALGVFLVGAATRSEEVVFDAAAFGGAFVGLGMMFARLGAMAGAGYLVVQALRRAGGRRPPA